MGQTVFLTVVLKVFGEFSTVVCLDSLSDKWGYFEKLPEEITAISRGVRLIGVGEGESGTDINGGEDIAFNPAGEDRDRVHLYEVAWPLR